MGWSGIYSICSPSWMLIRILSHRTGYFLLLLVSDLIRDIERAVYLSSSLVGSVLIHRMSCYIMNYLIFLVGEI